MQIKKALIYLVIIISLLGILFYMLFRGPSQGDIRRAIGRADYCGSAADCGLIKSVCPFGCSTYVNNGEVDRINEMLDGYNSSCQYNCTAPPEPVCRRNQCTK